MEPIIQKVCANAPSIIDLRGILDTDSFDLVKEDRLRGHQRLIVLLYCYEELRDCYVFILVKGFNVLSHCFELLLISKNFKSPLSPLLRAINGDGNKIYNLISLIIISINLSKK